MEILCFIQIRGIYLDIKYQPINGFKFINLAEKEHWVLDCNKIGIYNALMVCKPGNNILLQAIKQIVENVKTIIMVKLVYIQLDHYY